MEKDNKFKVPKPLGNGGRKWPKDPEGQLALMRLDILRYKKWIKNGGLVEAGPRKYIVAKVFEDSGNKNID